MLAGPCGPNPLMSDLLHSAVIQELLGSEQDFVGELHFLQSHHMQHLERCPHVPAAMASQKEVIFRNVKDIGRFHSRWGCRLRARQGLGGT